MCARSLPLFFCLLAHAISRLKLKSDRRNHQRIFFYGCARPAGVLAGQVENRMVFHRVSLFHVAIRSPAAQKFRLNVEHLRVPSNTIPSPCTIFPLKESITSPLPVSSAIFRFWLRPSRVDNRCPF